jgi:hypothetical protein
MHRFSTRLALLAALAAVACAAATATPAVAGPAPSAAEAPCWNGGPTAFDVNWDSGNTLRGAEREPVAWKDPPIGDAPDVVRKAATIPVYFHVFTDGAIGNLTNHQLQNQVNVLNTGFGGFEGGVATGFGFKLAGVERIDNPNWFYNLTYGSPVSREAKAATHVGDARTLNVWTTNGPGYLGLLRRLLLRPFHGGSDGPHAEVLRLLPRRRRHVSRRLARQTLRIRGGSAQVGPPRSSGRVGARCASPCATNPT